MQLPEGTTLSKGRYRITRFISQGGFGCTYEVFDTSFQERYAIKEFYVSDFCTREPKTHKVRLIKEEKKDLLDRLKIKFIQEAKNVNQFYHPNIVRVRDVFEDYDTAYFVMDYIDGSNLEDLITKEKRPLDEATAIHYIRQIAEALRYVHSKNILHLDLKPGNIMIDKKGNALLIDFGASKQYATDGQNSTNLVGLTPGYAPIEQQNNKISNFSPAVDIYSLGATLYKITTGITPPSAPLLQNEDEKLELSTLSPHMQYVITQSMQSKSANRPQSIDAFLQILQSETYSSAGHHNPSKQENEEVVAETISTVNYDVYPPKPNYPNDTPYPDNPGYQNNPSYSDDPDNQPTPYNNGDDQLPNDNIVNSPYFVSEDDARPKKTSRLPVIILVALALGAASFAITYYMNEFKLITDEIKVNGHEFVDLELPSGTMWATCNLGAKHPDETGDCFIWGNSDPASSANFNNNSYSKQLDPITGDSILDPATKKWGNGIHTPTEEEINELLSCCNHQWVTESGIRGIRFTSRKNGRSIFMPAPEDHPGPKGYSPGVKGGYWTATPDAGIPYSRGRYLAIDSASQATGPVEKKYAFSIRPVCSPKK